MIEREVEVPWHADVYINGYVACWFEPKWDGHWLYFYPVWKLANADFRENGNGLRYRYVGISM